MNRIALAMLVLLSACLQPMRKYTLGPLGAEKDRHMEVARAFTAAGQEVADVTPELGFVSTRWVAPYGNDWQRRYVAIVDPAGAVTLKMELQICRFLQPCVPLDGATGMDLEALDAVAKQVGEALKLPVTAQAPPT